MVDVQLTRKLSEIIEEGMTVLDIGANVGFYTVALAKLVGKSGRVYAFEPDPYNFSLLEENMERCGFNNVITVRAAVTDRSGYIDLHIGRTNRADNRLFSFSGSQEKISVPSISIDEYLDPKLDIDFIKIDIQGAEGLALEGMHMTLKRCEKIVLISEFSPQFIYGCGCNPYRILDNLGQFGFEIYRSDQPKRRIDRLAFNQFITDIGDQYVDLLCVKDACSLKHYRKEETLDRAT